jgi:hypothetical protein
LCRRPVTEQAGQQAQDSNQINTLAAFAMLPNAMLMLSTTAPGRRQHAIIADLPGTQINKPNDWIK